MRTKLAILAIVIGAAACGARVSPQQVEAAGRTAVDAGTPGSSTGAAVGAEVDGGATTTTVPGAVGAGAAPGAGTTPTSAAAARAGSSDNGGTTDVGLTRDRLRVGSVVTLSGPVPGLFAGAAYGLQAWAAYQNSLGGIDGRQVALDIQDDQFDTGQHRARVTEAIGKDFALVGSFSLYDDAAVPAIEQAGVTDIHVPLASAAQKSPNNFAVNPVQRGTPSGPWEVLKTKFPGSIGAVAGIYGDVPAAKDSYLNLRYAMQQLGYKFVYERGYQPTETDFTADVVRMKSAGVKFFLTGGDVKTAARLAKAMKTQNFKPDVFVAFGTAYDASFPVLAGDAGEGVINVGTQAMYLGEDAATTPEVKLFLTWLAKVKPGYKPDLFAAYGWSSGRLFAKAAQDAGPKLTRPGMLAAMRKITDWNAYGLLPPAGPGTKRPATCFLFEIVRNGGFQRWSSPASGFNCTGRFVSRP